MYTYRDRKDAGQRLVPLLAAHKGSGAIVFALPRGGVPIAIEIAQALGLPLDLLYVRKLGAPLQPELALGAVVDGADPDTVINESLVRRLRISRATLEEIAENELRQIDERRARYAIAVDAPLNPAGRVAIVVDDGLATGASVGAAVRALRRRGAIRVIVAVPVAPPDAVLLLEKAGAEVVCPHITKEFPSVGDFYRHFGQVSDESVIAQLLAFRAEITARTARGHSLKSTCTEV
jgi:predicted phosphoribosyltransferase